MHDVAKLGILLHLRPLLAIDTHVEVVIVNRTGLAVVFGRQVGKTCDAVNHLAHIHFYHGLFALATAPHCGYVAIDGRLCAGNAACRPVDSPLVNLHIAHGLTFGHSRKLFYAISRKLLDIGRVARLINHQLQGRCLNCRETEHTLVADCGAAAHFNPVAIYHRRHGERFHALPLGYIFLQCYGVDLGCLRQLAHQFATLLYLRRREHRCQQVVGKITGDVLVKLLDALHVDVAKQSVGSGRNVEQQHRVATNRLIINVNKLGKRLHIAVLLGVIEPSRTYRYVHFRRIPEHLASLGNKVAAAQVVARLLQAKNLLDGIGTGITTWRQHSGTPLAFAAESLFVAHPAHVVAHDCRNGIGLQLVDNIVIACPVIHLLLAIGAFGTSTIEPHLVYLAIVGEQLG